jgi:uncharacterized protein YdiU (UPF0061 family)
MRRKLGLLEARDGDQTLVEELLQRMAEGVADFTLTFRELSAIASSDGGTEGDAAVRALFADPSAFDAWAKIWRRRLAEEKGDPAARQAVMRAANPGFIPRNHRVEEALRAAVDDANMDPFDTLMSVLASPFDDQPEFADYARPPSRDEAPYRTFCGT